MGIEPGPAQVERRGGEGQRPKLSEAEVLTGALDEEETPTLTSASSALSALLL